MGWRVQVYLTVTRTNAEASGQVVSTFLKTKKHHEPFTPTHRRMIIGHLMKHGCRMTRNDETKQLFEHKELMGIKIYLTAGELRFRGAKNALPKASLIAEEFGYLPEFENEFSVFDLENEEWQHELM